MTTRLVTHFVHIRGALVVVVGATPEALAVARRAAALGARVRLVATDAAPARAAGLVEDIAIVEATPAPSHQDDAVMLVAAGGTDTAAVLAAARLRGLPAIDLGAGRAFLDEIAGSGRVQVAATTDESTELERFASILAGIRGKLEDRFPDESDRSAIWNQILDSPVMILLESGHDAEAVEMAERMAWGTG
jgi:siroheme synthase (precorrin-2 oxidase/ferrochelatase)